MSYPHHLLLLMLLAASAKGFEYFVSRQDGTGVCVIDDRKFNVKDTLPFYNIHGEDRIIPKEKEFHWWGAWHLENIKNSSGSTNYIQPSHKTVVTNGSAEFKRLLTEDFGPKMLVLAVNATFVWSEKEDWRRGKSIRVHLDPEGERNSTWAEYCTSAGTEREMCESLEVFESHLADRKVLNDGNKWTWLRISRLNENVTLFTENEQSLIKWTLGDKWVNRKTNNYFRPQHMVARTDSTPGIFWIPIVSIVGPSHAHRKITNTMSRNLTVIPGDKICLEILWQWGRGDVGSFKLEDSRGQVVEEGRLIVDEDTKQTRLDFEVGSGDYTIKLIDFTINIMSIVSCCSDVKIRGPASGCYVFEDEYRGFDNPPVAMLFPAPLNSSVQVDLNERQMKMICSVLNVSPLDPPLLFSGRWGGSFKTCP